MEITLLWGTWALGILTVVVFFVMRQRAVAAWNRSGPGVLHAEAMGSWLLAKARLESASVLPEAPVVRAFYEGRLVGGRSRSVFVREERRAVRMSVQILPIGGGETRSEGTITVPSAELAQLVPGTIFSVLYDPRDPRRFYVDTMHRDRILMDAATLRTRQAEENHRAQLAFSPTAGPQYR